jgi:hypothetical protein
LQTDIIALPRKLFRGPRFQRTLHVSDGHRLHEKKKVPSSGGTLKISDCVVGTFFVCIVPLDVTPWFFPSNRLSVREEELCRETSIMT